MVLYHGGDILTMVGDSPTYVEAVVEKGGIILFTGSLKDAREKHPDVREKDLEGMTLMPGHIEPHLHPAMSSLILSMSFITPFDWNLPSGKVTGVRTETGYRQCLQELIDKSTSCTEYLITWGYHQSFHGDMNRSIIDDLCRNKAIPVVVWHRSFHELYLNSTVLNNLEIRDQAMWDQCEQKDLVTGHFYEGGLDTLLAGTSFGDQVLCRMPKGYKEMVKVVHLGGITAISDLEFPSFDEKTEMDKATEFMKSPDANFSTYLVPSSRNYGRQCGGNLPAIEYIKAASEKFSNDKVILFDNHVKILFDGAFFSLAMQMKEPYTDGHTGEWITPPEEVEEVMRDYWNNGFQVHLHTNGDLCMEKLLDIVEKLNQENPRPNHKTTVEHGGYFTEDQAERMAKLGMQVSAAPFYFYSLCDRYSEDGLGEARAHAMNPLKWLFERGVPTALHSDFTMAPTQPLLLAWIAVNRKTAESGKVFREDLKISAYEAMLGITKNAAIILGTEEIMGTIEVGKYANFTLLKENPVKVEELRIKDIQVVASVYKGKMKMI